MVLRRSDSNWRIVPLRTEEEKMSLYGIYGRHSVEACPVNDLENAKKLVAFAESDPTPLLSKYTSTTFSVSITRPSNTRFCGSLMPMARISLKSLRSRRGSHRSTP